MKFYLDEDISPRVAALLRKNGIDAVSAHDIGMMGASDQDQLAEAVARGCALVTRNRDDFITLTVRFFEDFKPHHGVVIVSHGIPGSNFNLLARRLKTCARKHPKGMSPYAIEFIHRE